MNSVLVTGFPGFLASALVPDLAMRLREGDRIDCLVEKRFEALARRRAVDIQQQSGRDIQVLVGDITQPGLGLEVAISAVTDICREVFHLAAVYDLAVPLDLATRVNVDGTRNVLEFAQNCPHLSRFHHISTCYVSGKHHGVFRETDLNVEQTFGNHYESTKFLSEVLVQEAAINGIPTTIYRPSIVGGDSRTGGTQKMDGPYFFVQWLMAQPALALMPVFAGTAEATMNVVPSDYVTASIAHLSMYDDEPLKVYSLADPAPLTIKALTNVLRRSTGRRVVRVPATRTLARTLVKVVSGLHPRLNIPAQAVDYLGHPTHYDCTNTLADLAGSGIVCPPFTDYVDRLVDFVKRETGMR